jgi:hypothetical protein
MSTVRYMSSIEGNSSNAFNYMTNKLNTTSESNAGNANPFWVFLSFAWNGLKFMLFIPVMLTSFVADLISAFTGLGIPGFSIPFWFLSLVSAAIWVIMVFMIIRFLKGDTTNI